MVNKAKTVVKAMRTGVGLGIELMANCQRMGMNWGATETQRNSVRLY